MISETIGKILKRKRIESNITQSTLAKKLDLSRGCVASFETGRHHLPIETFCKVCRVLEVDPSLVLAEAISASSHLYAGQCLDCGYFGNTQNKNSKKCEKCTSSNYILFKAL